MEERVVEEPRFCMMDNRSYDACDDGKKGQGQKKRLPKSNRNIITRQYLLDAFAFRAEFVAGKIITSYYP